MAPRQFAHVVIVGAGAAGLMLGRELARAGKKVTVLDARDRCGGRIYPLPAGQFGYPAEGGRWNVRGGGFSPSEALAHEDRLRAALLGLKADLPVAEFLERHFADPQFSELRQTIKRMVEGYDAADTRKASTFALRDEWMGRGLGRQGRIAEGYGALIGFLESECRRQGAAIRLGAAVTAIDERSGGIAARCRDGAVLEGDAAILTVPLPVLSDIE